MSDLNLPCPRLELRWKEKEDGVYTHLCEYGLVLPLDELDCRGNVEEGERKTEMFVEIGSTKRGGCPMRKDGLPCTPFRDGTHIKMDCESLGGHLPMFATFKGKARQLFIGSPNY